MHRRPLLLRLVAVTLAALLGLTGPGAALAHGVAHEREHRVADHHAANDHHARHLLDRLAALVHGHEHDSPDRPEADAQQARTAAPSARDVETAHEQAKGTAVARPSQDDSAHGHPRVDAQAVSRLALAALLPAPPALVPVAPVIVATMSPPPATSPLRLAEPPTGPPPPPRAPPVG